MTRDEILQYVAPTYLSILIANLEELAAVFGVDFCAFVLNKVHEKLPDFGFPVEAMRIHNGKILIHLAKSHLPIVWNSQSEDAVALFIEIALESDAVELQGERAYLQIKTAFLRQVPAEFGVTRNAIAESGVWRSYLQNIVEQGAGVAAYRSDMKQAVRLLDDMRSGSLLMAFQSIHVWNKGEEAGLLYEEVLLRHETDAGYAVPLAIAALERVGLVTCLDRNVVWSAIAVLEQYPLKRLGVNVSACSMREGLWWRNLFAYLDLHPDVARRMTLEITETGYMASVDEACRLIAGLQGRHVRIALDNMGSGGTTLVFLAQAKADVIKIDRSILLRAEDTNSPPDLLGHLVQMCLDYSPCVIVEGIETVAELNLARASGAMGGQGFLFDKPTSSPSWLQEWPITVLDFKQQQARGLKRFLMVVAK